MVRKMKKSRSHAFAEACRAAVRAQQTADDANEALEAAKRKVLDMAGGFCDWPLPAAVDGWMLSGPAGEDWLEVECCGFVDPPAHP
jgi:hypothetical protein